MGLDRDDTVIRRRLRQKLEFLVDGAEAAGPADGRRAAAVARQAPGECSARAAGRVAAGVRQHRPARGLGRAEAERLLARLRAAGAEAKIDALGDATMLPQELPPGPVSRGGADVR